MENFSQLLQSGNAWVFIPSAILLGALHGLEPGHSKTMMAAFIVAVRGTVGQAVLLGLAATLSHTAVVWAVAMGGLYFGRNWSAEATEPYFQVASAALIILIALWMLWRTWREQQRERVETDQDHGHANGQGEERRRIDTGHGIVDLEVFEQGVPPRFRVRFEGQPNVPHDQNVRIETVRPDGSRQAFALASKGSYLESVDEIPSRTSSLRGFRSATATTHTTSTWSSMSTTTATRMTMVGWRPADTEFRRRRCKRGPDQGHIDRPLRPIACSPGFIALWNTSDGDRWLTRSSPMSRLQSPPALSARFTSGLSGAWLFARWLLVLAMVFDQVSAPFHHHHHDGVKVQFEPGLSHHVMGGGETHVDSDEHLAGSHFAMAIRVDPSRIGQLPAVDPADAAIAVNASLQLLAALHTPAPEHWEQHAYC